MAQLQFSFSGQDTPEDKKTVLRICQEVRKFSEIPRPTDRSKKPIMYLGEYERVCLRRVKVSISDGMELDLQVPKFFGIRIVWVHLGSHVNVGVI